MRAARRHDRVDGKLAGLLQQRVHLVGAAFELENAQLAGGEAEEAAVRDSDWPFHHPENPQPDSVAKVRESRNLPNHAAPLPGEWVPGEFPRTMEAVEREQAPDQSLEPPQRRRNGRTRRAPRRSELEPMNVSPDEPGAES